MITPEEEEMPLEQHFSFDTLLERYDDMAKSTDKAVAAKARFILDAQAPFPVLREGFSDFSLLDTHKDIIKLILSDTFSPILTHNEIKAASVPYHNIVFNSSERFNNIIAAAGKDFELKIRNQEEGANYIMAATVILNYYYGFHLDFKRPLFYDIPDANGVMRHYRILYNADFMQIIPKGTPKKLTQDDVDELLENSNNLELWKEKIPPGSFISRGFVISNMFDVTAEHAISEIKSSLIENNKRGDDTFIDHLQETFKSLFNLNDIRVGFVTYDAKEDQFQRVYGKGIESFILQHSDSASCDAVLCSGSYHNLLESNTYFTITNVAKYYKLSGGSAPYKSLHEQGIKSAIFAPIADENGLLGVLELVSPNRNELNSINATKLADVMPYIVSAVLRSKAEEENLIDAIIQNECTSVHASVYWRFQEEAKRFIIDDLEGRQPSFKEIVFKDVYPLYGQIDIKDSSKARNKAIQRDLMIQLSEISKIIAEANKIYQLPIYEELLFRIGKHINNIKEVLYTNSEQAIFDFVKEEIRPVLKHLKKENKDLSALIKTYEAAIDESTESYYDHRRNYDNSVMQINKKLVAVIDQKQVEAQEMFPHYFERYKTDGVEHNLYIGAAIAEDRNFNPLYLNNLRLWQLQVMCEMENEYYNLKPNLPIKLDVASLILVYNTSLSIRFRMDEKQFDVDGTYNARYEIIKKRIDKSYIKGTKERLTQTGKLAIVYSQKKDELEYLRYITFLKSKGYFTNNIEIVELEGLQGVSGLKAIRAEILYQKGESKDIERTYTYNDLMKELEA